jgi:hypothetical protein
MSKKETNLVSVFVNHDGSFTLRVYSDDIRDYNLNMHKVRCLIQDGASALTLALRMAETTASRNLPAQTGVNDGRETRTELP